MRFHCAGRESGSRNPSRQGGGSVSLTRERKQRGLLRKLVGLLVEGKRIARQHRAVYAGETKIGEVTSGTLSPTLGTSIAMALVDAAHARQGTALRIDLGKARVNAAVVKLPFYKQAGK